MREIKFRGKRLSNGQWIYGGISVFNGDVTMFDENDFANSAYDVDPATVGQYTGLKARNGKEIYEGDKLRIRGNVTAVVVWRNQGFDILDTCAWTPTNKGVIEGFVYVPTKTMEIIGNIHDDPELLKTE